MHACPTHRHWFTIVLLCALTSCTRPTQVAVNNPAHPAPGPDAITAAVLIQKGTMVYPPFAADHGIQGDLDVMVLVDTEGKPKKVSIVRRKLNPPAVYDVIGQELPVKNIFDEPSINFINGCRWKPALKDGKPIEASVVIPLHFKNPQQ